MENFFLDDPVYTEPEQSVKLELKNNIVMRSMRQRSHAVKQIGQDIWNSLDQIEQGLIVYMVNKGPSKRTELCKYTGKSGGTVMNRLRKLIDIGIVRANGNNYDPNRTYDVTID
jgi:ATP-dependent DNA helicase RecG